MFPLCLWDMQLGLQATGSELLPRMLHSVLSPGWGLHWDFFWGSTRGDKGLLPPLHPSLSDTTGKSWLTYSRPPVVAGCHLQPHLLLVCPSKEGRTLPVLPELTPPLRFGIFARK